MTDSKKSVSDMIESGFYAGVAASVGVVAVVAAPEICMVGVAAVVGYKAGGRIVDAVATKCGYVKSPEYKEKNREQSQAFAEKAVKAKDSVKGWFKRGK